MTKAKAKAKAAPAGALRRRAEQQLASSPGRSAPRAARPAAELKRLVHELQVHQIELELQNEELQRARAEVEAGLARYTDLYEFAPVGYLTLDRDGKIRQLNLTAARLLGLERSRLVGTHLGLRVAAASRPGLDGFLGRAFEGRTSESCEVALTAAALPPVVLELTGAVADDGSACRVAATDITERKRAALEHERLQAALAQAERLASVGLLAAGVAHEINNPLSFVLLGVDGLVPDLTRLAVAVGRGGAGLRKLVGDEQFVELVGDGAELLQPTALADIVRRATEVLEGTHRIREISRGLSSFARVEPAERSPVDLRSAIESAARMAAGETKYRARLQLELGPVPAILANEGRLAQVFLNLLINAAHAIDEGDAEHHRIVVRSWTEHDNAFVEVRDTGRGCSASELEHLFEPFFSTKSAGQGAGLGLAISRNLVRELGGDIRVESRVGEGTRFVVCLPVPPAPPAPQGRPAPAPLPPPAVVRRGRILVIDDEEPLRRAMVRVLGRDHEVLAVGSGREAQSLLERDAAFDLILCDLMMPDMTGMDLHAWLAGRNPALAAQVVFITGGVFTPRAAEYLRQAGNLRLDKPVDAGDLRRLAAERIEATRRKQP